MESSVCQDESKALALLVWSTIFRIVECSNSTLNLVGLDVESCRTQILNLVECRSSPNGYTEAVASGRVLPFLFVVFPSFVFPSFVVFVSILH